MEECQEQPGHLQLARHLLPPTLIWPVDTTGSVHKPIMKWHSSVAASSYRLQVATDNYLSNIVLDSTVSDTLLQLPRLNAYTKYYWHVSALNASDKGDYSAPSSFTTGDSVDALRNLVGSPTDSSLSENYPNPFNPATEIAYSVPRGGYVTLKVYNILGQEVETLFSGMRQPGSYIATFDGSKFASGVYFYRLSADGESVTKKLVLVK